MSSYWVGKREGDEGEGAIRIVRRAEEEEVKGQGLRHSLDQGEDTEGQMPRAFSLEPEGDDTIGHPRIRFIRPVDEEQDLHLIEVDSNEDVTGQLFKRGLSPEDDTEGHRFWRP